MGTLVNTNRTVKVHGYINDDENTNFITGMLIEASIISHVSKAISLPKSAVLK
ncbi:MAG: cobalt-zinc-cadmium efflux system membrane fusion protein, partial [Paraglaciecola sp.]